MTHRTTLVYNEFAQINYKGKWSHTSNLLYNKKNLIGRLFQYFYIYFETCSRNPVLAGAVHAGNGIRRLYPVSLPAFFIRHYREIPECFLLCLFLRQSGLLPVYERDCLHGTETGSRRQLGSQPVFLCIDDTSDIMTVAWSWYLVYARTRLMPGRK